MFFTQTLKNLRFSALFVNVGRAVNRQPCHRAGTRRGGNPFFHQKFIPSCPGSDLEASLEHLKNVEKITIFGLMGVSGLALNPGFLGA